MANISLFYLGIITIYFLYSRFFNHDETQSTENKLASAFFPIFVGQVKLVILSFEQWAS